MKKILSKLYRVERIPDVDYGWGHDQSFFGNNKWYAVRYKNEHRDRIFIYLFSPTVYSGHWFTTLPIETAKKHMRILEIADLEYDFRLRKCYEKIKRTIYKGIII